MKNEKQKQNYEAKEPSKKRMLLEKKKAGRDYREYTWITKEGTEQYKTIDSGKN